PGPFHRPDPWQRIAAGRKPRAANHGRRHEWVGSRGLTQIKATDGRPAYKSSQLQPEGGAYARFDNPAGHETCREGAEIGGPGAASVRHVAQPSRLPVRRIRSRLLVDAVPALAVQSRSAGANGLSANRQAGG